MASKDKLLKKIANNPKNVKFEDLKKLLQWYGFLHVSTHGSHHKFKKEGKSIVLPYKKPVKEIYIKQILELLKGEKSWKKM